MAAPDPMYMALSRGDLPAVQALIDSGTDVNQKIRWGLTPLLMASEDGRLEIVKLLLERGAHVNIPRGDGITPLYIASYKGRLEIVKTFLAYGADVNKAAGDGTSPLYIASQNGHLEIVKALLAAGADVNKTNSNGVPPLHIAAYYGRLEIVEALLASGADVNIYDVIEKARDEEFDPVINDLIISYAEPNNNSEETNALPSINQPVNAPLKCFDPIMANEANISIAEHAVFYIQDSTGNTTTAGCLDSEALNAYKSEPSYIFYKCKDTVPMSALHITRNSVLPTKYRLLNFAMRIYVKDSEAQQLEIGQSYVLKPVEPIGRIASKSVVDGGSVVSALHCGPADGSYLYSIHKVVAAAGGRRKRKTRRVRKLRSKFAKTRLNRRN